jgi:hypothetical protein
MDVRELVQQAYSIVTAQSPTVPLHGSDLSTGIRILNQLIDSFAGTSLLQTIATTKSLALTTGQQYVITGPSDYTPTPDIIGRVSNVQSAWIELDGVTYPLINISISEFESSYKYAPLQGLPRYIVVYPETEVTRLRIYPSPSQAFTFYMRAKSAGDVLTANSDLDSIPLYFIRFLSLALAKDLAIYKARLQAWTPQLEAMYAQAKDEMIAASEVNLAIQNDQDSMASGAWRVRSGV